MLGAVEIFWKTRLTFMNKVVIIKTDKSSESEISQKSPGSSVPWGFLM